MNKKAFVLGYHEQLSKLATVPNDFNYPDIARNQAGPFNQVKPAKQPARNGSPPAPPIKTVLPTG